MQAEKGQAFHNVNGPIDILLEKAECVPYALFAPIAVHSTTKTDGFINNSAGFVQE